MNPNLIKCIRLYPNVSNPILLFLNEFKTIRLYPNVSNPIQSYLPNVSDCNQNLNLTFKSTNKDNTIYYNLDNLAIPIIKESIIKTTN
jgi:hypothetical protein